MAQTEAHGLTSFDMAPVIVPGPGDTVHWSADDRMPLAPPAAQKSPEQPAIEPQRTVMDVGSTVTVAQDDSYFHGGKRVLPPADTLQQHAQNAGMLPRSGEADPYYRGAIPRTRVLDGVGNVVDVALPLGASFLAARQIGQIYNENFAATSTWAANRTRIAASQNLANTIRQARQPELDQATVQMRNLARQTGLDPANDTTWLRMNRDALTAREANLYDNWHALRFPRVDAAGVQQAERATVNPAIRTVLRDQAATLATAEANYQARYTAADVLAAAMRNGGAASLAIGETANFAIDRTLFNKTPHSLRSIIFDTIAPAVVLAEMPWQAKAAVIVGTHLVNRFIDTRTDNVGNF